MTENEVNSRLQAFGRLPCWKVGLAYGSVLYLELGQHLEEKSDDPSSIIGALSVWLYADDWRIEQSGESIADSDSVDREMAEGELAVRFTGKFLERLSGGGNHINLVFSDAINIMLWKTEASDIGPEDDLVHCFLPDGEIICFSTKKQFYLSQEIDHFRASVWRRAHS